VNPTSNRIARVRAALAQKSLPAIFITQIENVRWLSGFTGSNGIILLTETEALFATDSRYLQQAELECPQFRLEKFSQNPQDDVLKWITNLGVSKIGFEANHLSYRTHEKYRSRLPDNIALEPTDNFIEELRMVKDSEEIACIEAACAAADRAFEYILPFLKPGAIERDVMLELEWYLRKDEGTEIAFDTIVASGPRSALPHGRASLRAMQKGDFVTLDFGARLNQYCSDITRTIVLGEPTDEQRKVYQTVLDALHKGIEAIRPHIAGKDVDAVAREFIREAGYGDYFGHGLGHSLGRNVHDGPSLSPSSEVTLSPGMVTTVEPGIYIPGWGGVRIEQDVLVTESTPRILTHSPTHLLAL
jgi:Xaa-Pro aminopeptidase